MGEEIFVLDDAYWLRDLASKAARRVKKLVGRPDPTPWILRPKMAARQEGYVDLVLVPNAAGNDAALTQLLHEALSPLGVSLLVATEQTAAALADEVRAGKIRPHVLLNVSSGGQFAELMKAAEGAGICVINDASKRAEWCAGESSLEKFGEAGLAVRSSAPGNGDQARRLRVFNIFGAKTLLWWTSETRRYEAVSWDEVREHNLIEAERLCDRVSEVTGLDFFYSEIAITHGDGPPRFELFLGCNDQFDLMPGSVHSEGMPDEWVKWICERIAEFVWRKKNGVAETAGHLMWLGGKSENSVSLAEAKKRMGTAA
jgi:hypothetical protein